MTLKFTSYILVGFLFITLSCSKNKLNDTIDSKNDSAGIYMQKARNQKKPYELQVLYTKKAVALLLLQENDSLNSDQLILMARNFNRLNSWDNLKSTSQKVLTRSIEKNDDYFVGQSYRWLGVYYENISKNDSAFFYYSKAEKIFKKLNNKFRLCDIYQDKALVQFYTSDFLSAESSLIRALKTVSKLDVPFEKIRIYISLGLNSFAQKDYNSSLKYYNKALLIIKGRNNGLFKNAEEVCLNNIAQNYIKCAKYDNARLLLERSLKINIDQNFIKYPSDYATSLDLLGKVKLMLKNNKGIDNLLLKASKIRDSLHIDQGRNINKLFLSEYYQATNQITKAQDCAHEAYSLSKSFRNASDMLECLKQLCKVDTKNALKYSEEYIRISDSMQQLERDTRNKFAKIAFETEEITSEKEEAIQQKRIFFAIAVLIFIIGALIVLLLMQRAKQKELRFLQEQQKTNEEIYQLIQNQQSNIDVARHIEKKRIAQDLHDGIMNRLSSTRLNLHILNEKATPEIIRKCLPFIAGIQDIEKEIRNVSHNLNKDALFNKVSFVVVVESFVAEQKEHFKGKCHLEIDPTINWEWLTSFQKINIFRILQEAFQNTNKHAQAQNIIISFLKSENQLLLEIFDDGVGFSLKQKKKGIGLQNIYSRAKQCNGNAEIKSDLGTGTTLTITIPFNPIYKK